MVSPGMGVRALTNDEASPTNKFPGLDVECLDRIYLNGPRRFTKARDVNCSASYAAVLVTSMTAWTQLMMQP